VTPSQQNKFDQGSEMRRQTPNGCVLEVLPVSRPLSPSNHEAFRQQLERILTSQVFRNSHRCQTLLRYLVARAVDGDTSALKERTLGMDVFGLEPDYDTSQQPVVRATAAEIRKKLAQYYQQREHDAEPRIELAAGSYVLEFRSVVESPATVVRRPLWLSAGAAIGLLLAFGAYVLVSRVQRTALDDFWQPVLQAPGSALLCLGGSGTYVLTGKASDRMWDLVAKSPPGTLAASKELIPINAVVPMWDRYYSVGDVNSLIHLTSLLAKHGKAFEIRGGPGVTFDQLREHPAVLIGAFNNQWAMRVAGALRYRFAQDANGTVIRDRDNPGMNDWRVTDPWPEPKTSTDYAIVSRVLDTATNRIVVLAGGITEYGTAAAGEFLSDPGCFSEAASRFRSGWRSRNLQVVLATPVIHGAPGRPRVIATYVW